MNEDYRDDGWPTEAGEVADLPREMKPPPSLEDRVTGELLGRGLIAGHAVRAGAPTRRSAAKRRAFTVAASLLLLVASFVAGRLTIETEVRSATVATSAPEPTKYALLLYESDGYRPAAGDERLARYYEYGEWVADARQRDQFVTGEDLAVDRGRVIAPVDGRPTVSEGVRLDKSAPLSGVFLITARDYADALDLAASLPHLTHGGQVVVQEVIPTEQPPQLEPGPTSSEG